VTSSSFDDDQYVDDQDSMYFGLKEYCDSIKWTHQFPLFRQDDAFERMALRTTRFVQVKTLKGEGSQMFLLIFFLQNYTLLKTKYLSTLHVYLGNTIRLDAEHAKQNFL
jgi:hypothetical protein